MNICWKIYTQLMTAIVGMSWVDGKWDQELGTNEILGLFSMLQSIY